MGERALFLTSNILLVVNVVFFSLGDSPASEFVLFTRPMKVEQTMRSETSAHKIQTPRIHPKIKNKKEENTILKTAAGRK
jgi:hypothetical protein